MPYTENQKKIVKDYFHTKEGNFYDELKAKAYAYFVYNEDCLGFLRNIEEKDEIKRKIEFLFSKMILKDIENVEEAVAYYV